ncbi:hypothetical protein BDW68DRAFT_173778 [Aspergillus falconensis]
MSTRSRGAKGKYAELSDLPAGAKHIAEHLKIVSDYDWADGPENPSENRQVTAMVLQRRGDQVEPPCGNCKNGNGIWKTCVTAPSLRGIGKYKDRVYAFQGGSCANCIWHTEACPFNDVKTLDKKSLRHVLSGGRKTLYAEIKARNGESTDESERNDDDDDDDGDNDGDDSGEGTGKGKSKGSGTPARKPKRNIETTPSSTFFGAFMPGKDFTRVGVQHQRGPKCSFDGDELRFPVSREIWEDPRRLLTARCDLATFAAIVDARLYELGSGEQDNDYLFWQKEARRIHRLYKRPLTAARGPDSSAKAMVGEWSTRAPATQEGSIGERPIEIPATPHNSVATFTIDGARAGPDDGSDDGDASRAAAERASQQLRAALEEDPRGRKRHGDDEDPNPRPPKRRPLAFLSPAALRLPGVDDDLAMPETQEPSRGDEMAPEMQPSAENEVADPQGQTQE